MFNLRLQRQIAWEAACLIFWRHETEYYRAKLRAARRLRGGLIRSDELPTNAQLDRQLHRIARQFHRFRPGSPVRDRCELVLERMRSLADFQPHVLVRGLIHDERLPQDIVLQVFSDRTVAIAERLTALGVCADRLHVSGSDRSSDTTRTRRTARFLVTDRIPWQLDVYPQSLARCTMRNRRTGKRIRRWNLSEFAERLEVPHYDGVDQSSADLPAAPLDRFALYRGLLIPLEQVRQNRQQHPEGDLLYHSLQVFQLARDEIAYDEEFLLACLLHEVGQAIDPGAPIDAALEALAGSVTERTAWFIQHQDDAESVFRGLLGQRALRRLKRSEDYDQLMLMARCDRQGRRPGAMVPDVDEAIDFLRELSDTNG